MQGIQLREPQSIMDLRNLERLSSELVRLCDSVEKHGLVDYQMGVAEEEIMDCKSSSHDMAIQITNKRHSTPTVHSTAEPSARPRRRSGSYDRIVSGWCS